MGLIFIFVVIVVAYTIMAFNVFPNVVFAKKNFIFSGISTVMSLDFVKCSSLMVLLRRLGSAKFFPSVHIIWRFGKFIRISWNLYTLWLGLTFCVNRYIIGLWSQNNIMGSFDPVKRNAYSVDANMFAEHSLMRFDSVISMGEKRSRISWN